ncbi:hypothetical protein [Sinorhizobium alkalisoli]|uniref:Uncharacterized protein n=1 Tax=Sinorhizobium alkalisoli TaxID=1752398 RepID=A0A1E3VBD9_9HYPH|nr:hypothetical protein [Sinorhizobium alkalisoli]ODR90892.1 hypothetical protein A8M32_12755 [Sinorhizobium alkalisoli]
MFLREALKLSDDEEIDPTLPLNIGEQVFSADAAAEAARILGGGEFVTHINIEPRDLPSPFYWDVIENAVNCGQVFGFPSGWLDALPTAIELAIVRALSIAEPERHEQILGGTFLISLGKSDALSQFERILSIVRPPMVGQSILWQSCNQADISANSKDLLSVMALKCLENSFLTAPLKFRFLEVYRIMEARFLHDVELRLKSRFASEPQAALEEALDSVKSELKQLVQLADTQQDAFEAIRNELATIKGTNKFAAALYRKLSNLALYNNPAWKAGAALVYAIRCAIVHAGQKDIIFEQFPDGDEVLQLLLPLVERAALLLVGVSVS